MRFFILNKSNTEEIETTFDGLPEKCWAVLPPTNKLIMVKRGVKGYTPQREDVIPWGPENKDALNKRLGVTKAQENAMISGSMFGWHVPAANPANYDDEGNPID